MNSITNVKSDMNYIDEPKDRLAYVLKDIFEANNVDEAERIPLFQGIVNSKQTSTDRTLYFIDELKTLLETPIEKNPYHAQPLSVLIGFSLKKSISVGAHVIVAVAPAFTLGTDKWRPHEVLSVEKYYSFDDLHISINLPPLDRATALCESRVLSAYKESIISLLARRNVIYDLNDRKNYLQVEIENLENKKIELNETIESNSGEIERLSKRKEELQHDIDELSILREELPGMRSEKAELDEILPNMRREKEVCDLIIGQREDLKSEIEALTKEKAKLEEGLPAMRKEKEQLADILINYIAIKDKYDAMTGRIKLRESNIINDFEYAATTHLDFSLKNGGIEAFEKRTHFIYKKAEIIKFLLALSTMQIITLCGDPGTGKTTFVTEMADALGAKRHMIEVQNNWTDRSDILGYYNPLDGGKYQSTRFLDALLEAKSDLEENKENARLHIICLDEMNLARVEYYFATFLSILQHKKEERIIRLLPEELDNIAADEDSPLHPYYHFELPTNVRFVGTLNMDESAQFLSPKVIDRCFFIEFENGNCPKQTPTGEIGYYPASIFAEPVDDEKGGEVADYFEQENHRFKHYVNQMQRLAKTLNISNTDFEDYLVMAKVLPRIKRRKDFEDVYLHKDGLIESKKRFKKFIFYGNNDELCDFWRKK